MAHAAPNVHCWNAGPMILDDATGEHIGTTCMLADGHDGPCVFTRDDEIGVCLAELEERYDDASA